MDTVRARQEPIDLGPLPGLLGHLLRRAHGRMQTGFAEAIAGLGVTASEFALLCLVEANPGITLGQLAHAAALDKSTLSPAMQRLTERQLVERQPVSGDRRTQALCLSPAGAALLPSLKACVETYESDMAAPLTSEERETLLSLLRKLNGL
ncbi:MarR family transcriptional regulator [Roseomonas sp. E05]|uniref:MarR family winged helix-turn-helix transcriptional regulator n=1 Tax=Roseomonas sp. E05 TaxID=3046310 RepID=UPI0024BBE3AD|nr:MarR family transcriptional regulator [Roseomonas sp. E05]MDJ0388159.1 MarR family transcriptional regulator [Roseomonas sp. E05]